MATYNTSDFKKGIKIQIDGEPYLMVECNFVKPGKGNALYKCKLKNLIRGTNLDRTSRGATRWKPPTSAKSRPSTCTAKARSSSSWTTRTTSNTRSAPTQVDDAWKYLKEGMVCSVMLFNDNPIIVTPPNHVVLKVEYAEPAVRGNTATNLTKPVKLETGAEFIVPAFVEQGEMIRIDTRTGEYIERVRE